jgi:hypothetical protein
MSERSTCIGTSKETRGTTRALSRLAERSSWLKIKNPDYSQIVDRHELLVDQQRPEGRARA